MSPRVDDTLRWIKLKTAADLAKAVSADGWYFFLPESQLIVEAPDGSVFLHAPEEQCSILEAHVPTLPILPEDEVYVNSLPMARDPLLSFKPFNHSNSSIPLLKRHVAQLLAKRLPSRAHPIFDRPPDPQGPDSVLPPRADDTDGLARADPGFSLTHPTPDRKLLVSTGLNLADFSLNHFKCCAACNKHGGSYARSLDPTSPSFCEDIFKAFAPRCYAQHLYRCLWFGYEPALTSTILPFSVSNYKSLFNPVHKASLERAWQKQLDVPDLFGPGDDLYVSPLTLATRFIDLWESEETGLPPKSRVCFDASRGINGNVTPWRFRYNDFPYLLSQIRKGDFIGQLDLRSWYLQLSVRKRFQRYLSLKCPLTGKLLRYRRLPFGLSTAPGFASLVSSELCRFVRAAGFSCVVSSYIDDLTFIGDEDEVRRALAYTLQMLEQLGIGVAPEKVFWPAQVATVLGIVIDTKEGVLRAKPEHVAWTQRVIASVLKRRRLTKRKLQSLAGMLNWISPLVRGSRPYMRGLWNLFKRTSSTISAGPELIADLKFWRSALHRLKRTNCQMPFLDWGQSEKVVMYSDASGDQGCGIWLGHRFFRHLWTEDQLSQSVPWKELWPIVQALKLFGPQLRNKVIISATDSATNSYAINAGSSRAPGCNSLLKELSKLERQLNSNVIAVWSPREFNCVTDFLSKFELPGLDLLQSSHVSLFSS